MDEFKCFHTIVGIVEYKGDDTQVPQSWIIRKTNIYRGDEIALD